ncbi:flagellar basal body rod protein FlgC [Pseudobacteriovorax antillogorgiicola]|uniref:Flagellar basal-body rod protein FlgC n=1 Tax=Pseudobacteriovorax antillogorgiicola TaxID=1513793 RepID=A0A1Y6CJ57_9BACT|nr:flagellar basal body rod protein FlgC [Pseudobacteriovorax antillogorgiicola]TCS46113.1 flagellar basal-body rod protein FlgC [Pseudobacteriovorax antillogorgiicola]SMF69473.1 flagellar basal-body rod protein FlgC [Pseudobacteriovorax antillogorgiicola]
MSFFKAMNISSAGLSAQRLRMNILSANLANANTTRTPEGGPYKRQDAVFSATPVSDTPFADFLDEDWGTQLKKVKVVDIHEDTKSPRKVHDPSHPDADADGFVEMPNIQVMSEMVNMITATRSFESNTTAMNAAKTMATKALEIGR